MGNFGGYRLYGGNSKTTAPLFLQYLNESANMPPYEGVVDWRRQQVPGLMGLAGALMVAFNFMIPGFLLIVAALLYAGYKGDASMKDKDTW